MDYAEYEVFLKYNQKNIEHIEHIEKILKYTFEKYQNVNLTLKQQHCKPIKDDELEAWYYSSIKKYDFYSDKIVCQIIQGNGYEGEEFEIIELSIPISLFLEEHPFITIDEKYEKIKKEILEKNSVKIKKMKERKKLKELTNKQKRQKLYEELKKEFE